MTHVETEPAEPDENSAQEDKRWVVWLAVRGLTRVLSLAEHEGVSKGRATRSNVDWSSTSKVERWEVKEPAIGVPCPARDWAVDNGSPAECEDQGWQDSATLEGATNDKLDGDGAEEELVEHEDDFWKGSITWRWSY